MEILIKQLYDVLIDIIRQALQLLLYKIFLQVCNLL